MAGERRKIGCERPGQRAATKIKWRTLYSSTGISSGTALGSRCLPRYTYRTKVKYMFLDKIAMHGMDVGSH